jgi:hypothetical protein
VPSCPGRGAAAHAAINAGIARSLEKLHPGFRAIFSIVHNYGIPWLEKRTRLLM